MKPPFKIPVVVAFLRPFRIVLGNGDQWACSLHEINNGTYDYAKLCKEVAAIDVGILPYSMIVCLDGTLVLPALPAFKSRELIAEKFNEILGYLLFGGVFAERVEPIDICRGELIGETSYVRAFVTQSSSSSLLAGELRSGEASQTTAIALYSPPVLRVEDLVKAYDLGKSRMAVIPHLSPQFLIQGASSMMRRSWSEALAAFWISVEQIVTFIWTRTVVESAKQTAEAIPKRIDMLEDDRTFTTGVKVEVLFQKSIIDVATLSACSIARRARNRLSHAGSHASRSEAVASFEAATRLLAIASAKPSDSYLEVMDAYIDKHATDHPRPASIPVKDTDVWRPIKALPGEPDWGTKPFDTIANKLVPVEELQDNS
ncbi:MAG: hypothetical protein ACTHLZ_16870 [Tepidisphaeraceae bacterium]